MNITIDVTLIAQRMMDSLKLTDEEWQDLDRDGRVPAGWSDVLLDNLTAVHDLEGDVINEMVRLNEAHTGRKDDGLSHVTPE